MVDPFLLEVVRNGVYSIAEEMGTILKRSARSPLLKEAGDMSCALTDGEGRLIAQGRDLPIHLGIMAFTVKEFLKRISVHELRQGDVYYTNLLEVGGNHLPDVKVIKPIFVDDVVVAFAINLAHWPDIGGAMAGSYVPTATDLFQEGLQIPPLRLFTERGINQELLKLILQNIRNPTEREGDIYAQYACVEVAAKRLGELYRRHGRNALFECFNRFHDESEILMKRALEVLPPGHYRGEDFLDDDGVERQAIRIAVAIQVAKGRICFDFAGTAPECSGPLNCTIYSATSAVYYACKALLGPDIPPNEGCYRPIDVLIPQGSVLWPRSPNRPVCGNHETAHRVVDAIFKALAPALPQRVVAGGAASSGVLIINTRDGVKEKILFETHGGGEGGSAHRPGANGIRVHLTNTMNTPIEAIESEYPLQIDEYALRDGSGGAGLHDGGNGIRRSYRILCEHAEITLMFDRCSIPPWPLFGGNPGANTRIVVNPNTPLQRMMFGKDRIELKRGDVIQIETSGGAGYGVTVGPK